MTCNITGNKPRLIEINIPRLWLYHNELDEGEGNQPHDEADLLPLLMVRMLYYSLHTLLTTFTAMSWDRRGGKTSSVALFGPVKNSRHGGLGSGAESSRALVGAVWIRIASYARRAGNVAG